VCDIETTKILVNEEAKAHWRAVAPREKNVNIIVMHAFCNAFLTELLPNYTGCISNAGIKSKRMFFTSHQTKRV